jgi:hypothetical protein
MNRSKSTNLDFVTDDSENQRSFGVGDFVRIHAILYFRQCGVIKSIIGTGRSQKFRVKLQNNEVVSFFAKDV